MQIGYVVVAYVIHLGILVFTALKLDGTRQDNDLKKMKLWTIIFFMLSFVTKILTEVVIGENIPEAIREGILGTVIYGIIVIMPIWKKYKRNIKELIDSVGERSVHYHIRGNN